MSELVNAGVCWIEENGCGPSVVDDGRCEGLVGKVKEGMTRAHDTLARLPEVFDALSADAREKRKGTPVLHSTVTGAADEILAPCMFMLNTHLGDNWEAFCARWSVRYANYWRKSEGFVGAWKFLVGNHGGEAAARTEPPYVHFMCGSREHLFLALHTEWVVVE